MIGFAFLQDMSRGWFFEIETRFLPSEFLNGIGFLPLRKVNGKEFDGLKNLVGDADVPATGFTLFPDPGDFNKWFSPHISPLTPVSSFRELVVRSAVESSARSVCLAARFVPLAHVFSGHMMRQFAAACHASLVDCLKSGYLGGMSSIVSSVVHDDGSGHATVRVAGMDIRYDCSTCGEIEIQEIPLPKAVPEDILCVLKFLGSTLEEYFQEHIAGYLAASYLDAARRALRDRVIEKLPGLALKRSFGSVHAAMRVLRP